MGQDYITREFSTRVGIDLKGLDPDGAGKEGGLFRWNTALSMIPTTLGIWIDGWNVKGFLIKERAVVYATQMRYPETCPHCGEAHVPYWEVMKATGKQLSLAYQLVPFGAIIGKACEYLNDPPLFYWGRSLKCYKINQHVLAAREGMPKKMSLNKT